MPTIPPLSQPTAHGSRYRSRIVPLNGAPALFVNDQPLFLCAPYLQKSAYETFAKVGTGVYALHDHYFEVSPDGIVDTTYAEGLIAGVLEKEPGALFFTRSYLPFPKWWMDKNPDEVRKFDMPVSEEFYRDASFASDLWLEEGCGWYMQWISFLHKRFGGQVIGYSVSFGANGENGLAGAPANDWRWFCDDFSPAMLRYFRAWLTKKYGTDAALRKAWSQPNVTLETAQVPDRIERQRSEWFTFRNPLRSQTSDFYRAYAERVQHIAITLCQTVKNATHGECIAGSHLGAIMDNGYHGMMYHQMINSTAFKEALNHPAVDTFTTPASYECRAPGGDANSMMPAGSMALHGKLIYQDQDTRTSVLPPGKRGAYMLSDIAVDAEESTHVLKRDVAHQIIRGYGCWPHAMTPGMFEHPLIKECWRRLVTIGNASQHFPRGIADNEAAIIIDEHSSAYQQCANRLCYSMLYYQRQNYWNRSGIPWSLYLHDDLEHPNLPKHKLFYFLNTFFLTDDEMKAVQRKLRGSGATAIWTYAPGIQSPAGLSLERASELTGFRLKSVDIEAIPLVSITNRTHPYVTGMDYVPNDMYAGRDNLPVFFGTGDHAGDSRAQIGPIIYADDPGATVLGEIAALRQPGFCVKEMDGWTSVYSAAPMLNQYLLRNIARAAGLHVWSTGDDVVLPGKSFVMIHAKQAGEKTINLPYATDVYECYDGREVGKNLTEIKENMERHATALYFLGSKKQFEKAVAP